MIAKIVRLEHYIPTVRNRVSRETGLTPGAALAAILDWISTEFKRLALSAPVAGGIYCYK